jgi:hypothetical protein
MGVYQGKKPAFPNYLLYAVDAAQKPTTGELTGVPAASGRGNERGQLLKLADAGLRDAATGLRGWNMKADVGMQSVRGGLFYFARNSGGGGRQTADLTLMRWTGDDQAPFLPATSTGLTPKP